ncbi:MAG: TIGR04053 family radical SAM/SPASM domain-containing protein [Chloroflexi bacterium]|nr:TIGR04053 family radical SAM/SPASM domain-containing protein [Chloroflexota bacterium]
MERDPVVVFWELTQACALVCRHCRANAQPKRHPLELATQECFRVMDGLASFDRPPIVILTGGDPFMRRDLFDLVRYGIDKGLLVSVSPGATALVTNERLRALKQAGVSRISFSLDGSRSQVHDHFRGVPGSFLRTSQCISNALDAGLSVQVNTTVTQWVRDDLPALEEVVTSLGAPAWDLFFLVPTGRGLVEDMLSPEEMDGVFHWLYELGQRAPFQVRVTLGQPYRRVWVSRKLASLGRDYRDLEPSELLDVWEGGSPSNDGKGVMFVSHLGEVYPSGFLPLRGGNVRKGSVVDIYRDAPVFRSLRDPQGIKGKCGVCPFRLLCGGCRARAYALTGDYLAADPTCPFVPPGIEE